MSIYTKKIHVNKGRVNFKSRNIYRQSLINLYDRIAANTTNTTLQKISARLRTSKTNRHPISTSILAENAKSNPEKIQVVIAKVLDDEAIFVLPKIRLCCLDISKSARAKIEKNGGEIYTLDQLFDISDNLKDVLLLKGDSTNRKCYKYFGACGEKGSKTYPRCSSKGKNREKRILK